MKLFRDIHSFLSCELLYIRLNKSIFSRKSNRTMKQIIYLLILFSVIQNVNAQISHTEYLDRCDIEFESLCKLLSKTEVESWRKKSRDIANKHVEIANKKEQEEGIYKQINAEAIYATQYLNLIYNFLLPAKTSLVNSLSNQVVKFKVEDSIKEQIDSLDILLSDYAYTKNAINFEKTYHRFLNVKSNYKNISSAQDTLFYTIYESKNNVFATPDSIESYIICDWKSRIEELSRIKEELDNIFIEIKAKQFLIVKDPNPAIPLIFQFCTLFVVISNAVMNFGFNKKLNTIIFLLVILSLFTSMILLFLSENTLFNLAINVIVPGLAYIGYYIVQKKKINT